MTPRKKPETPAEQPVETPDTSPAGAPAIEAPLPEVSRMVAFHLGSQRYGLPIDSVQEIQQIVAFAEVPDESGAVLGMVNLRGQVVPAVDLRLLLGMEPRAYTLETPMVICRSGQGLVALIVDVVDDVTELPEGCLQPAPAMHSLAGRMVGVCRLEGGMVFLLDVDRLLEPVDLDVCADGEVPTDD